MRDALGGTFVIYVLLIFMAVYITFVAVAFNYARAFRVKNKVIDIIEQNEGIDFENSSDTSSKGQIETYLGNINYLVKGISNSTKACNGYEFIDSERGYCIDKISNTNPTGLISSYYKIVTFVRLEIPFMNLGFTIPIKGETRRIERSAN